MLLLVDLDGVLYRGTEAVPGVADVLARRAANGDTIIYCTNNSRWHRTEYVSRLAAFGAPVTPESVVSSARATALALAEGDRPRLAMVFGGPGLARELRDVGIRVVGPTLRGVAGRPDVVVVGIDFRLSHRRLSMAARAVRAGARVVATNRDPTYPVHDGPLAGAGSIVAALEVAGGRAAEVTIGKPSPLLFETAARSVDVPVTDAVVIGDSLASDIAAANALGARSILMLTGVSTRAEADVAAADARPTAIAADADELERTLEMLARL